MIWIVQCPKCSWYQLYHPKPKSKRYRKACTKSNCNLKFTAKPIERFSSEKEAMKIRQKLEVEYHKDHRTSIHLDDSLKEIQKQVFPIIKTHSDNKNNGPFGKGPKGSPYDQDQNIPGVPPKPEVDKLQGKALLEPKLYQYLLERGMNPKEGSYFIQVKREGFSFEVYSSGIVNFSLDSSDDLIISQAQGILSLFAQICNKSEVTYEINAIEVTLNVPKESDLGRAFLKTLPTGTKLAMINPLGHFKVYLSGEEFRVEAPHLTKLVQGVEETLEGKFPNIEFRDRFLIFQGLHEGDLEYIKENMVTRNQLASLTISNQRYEQDRLEMVDYIGRLTGNTSVVSENLVAISQTMGSMNNQVQDLNELMLHSNRGINELKLNGSNGNFSSAKLAQLNQLLQHISNYPGCTIKEVSQQFTWSNGKTDRLLKALILLGEVERVKAQPNGKGRPCYKYQQQRRN